MPLKEELFEKQQEQTTKSPDDWNTNDILRILLASEPQKNRVKNFLWEYKGELLYLGYAATACPETVAKNLVKPGLDYNKLNKAFTELKTKIKQEEGEKVNA